MWVVCIVVYINTGGKFAFILARSALLRPSGACTLHVLESETSLPTLQSITLVRHWMLNFKIMFGCHLDYFIWLKFARLVFLGCRAIGGTPAPANCIFPFKYKGIEYTGCTTAESENGHAWCAYQVQPGRTINVIRYPIIFVTEFQEMC